MGDDAARSVLTTADAHVEGRDGMLGMVTALVIQNAATAGIERSSGVTSVVAAAAAGGSTAFLCQIP